MHLNPVHQNVKSCVRYLCRASNRAGSPHFKIVRFKWWEHVTTNQYLERGLLTGITRLSKESIFSDLNNLEVVTTTSEKYSSSFSFREGQQGQEKSQKHRSHWKGDSK